MKKSILAFLALALLLAVPSMASAQVKAGSVHISPMIGYYFNDMNYKRDGVRINFDDGMIYTIGLGYNFTENWGLEFSGNYAPSLDNGGGNAFGYHYDGGLAEMDLTVANLNVLYHFTTDTPFVPYVIAGGGGQWGSVDFKDGWGRWSAGNYSAGEVNAGLGFKYFFNDVVALRVQGQWLHGFSDGNWESNDGVAVQAGLTFQFGPSTGCVDSDNDGVCDEYDKCPGTPAGYKVDANGCPITKTIRMDVLFDFDKSLVKQQYLPEVGKVATFMEGHPNTSTVVEGHTDNIGTAAYNQKLSERRARAVYEVLVNHFGIAPGRLTYVGHGLTQPIADNSTEEGRAQNRRVVGVVSGPELD